MLLPDTTLLLIAVLTNPRATLRAHVDLLVDTVLLRLAMRLAQIAAPTAQQVWAIAMAVEGCDEQGSTLDPMTGAPYPEIGGADCVEVGRTYRRARMRRLAHAIAAAWGVALDGGAQGMR